MALTREQRFARIDQLEGWARACGQVSYGALVLTFMLCLLGKLVHAVFGLLVFCLLRLVEKLVQIRVRLHIRRLGLTK